MTETLHSIYDERYRRLYDEGITYWNEHEANPLLLDLLSELEVNSHCLDMGCGEGFEARAMAEHGMNAVGVDLSKSAILKAQSVTPSNLRASFMVGDVCNLKPLFPLEQQFDVITNIGCLHLLEDKSVRSAHFAEIKRLLKRSGYLYLQNSLDLDDVVPTSNIEEKLIEKIKVLKNSTTQLRQIKTEQGEKLLEFNTLPCISLTLEQYKQELDANGFKVEFATRSGGANLPFEAVIIARPM